jgi:hypothetical protein
MNAHDNPGININRKRGENGQQVSTEIPGSGGDVKPAMVVIAAHYPHFDLSVDTPPGNQ